MSKVLKSKIRPLILPILHRWQHFYDFSRGRWREFTLRGAWQDFRDRRTALKRATPIIEDSSGIRFVLYPWDRKRLLYLYRHPHDVAEFAAIRRLVKPGDIAFDVGANIGTYSVLLGGLCGSAGRVWAFEPVPDTYWRLRETLVLNRSDNVIPLQRVVCERSGVARVNLFEPKYSEWNTLGNPSMVTERGYCISPSASVDVPSCTLDDFCGEERIERIHFIKIDVEGFELSVFQGAQRLLRQGLIDCICFEISKDPLKGAGIESKAVFDALAAHGYLAYRFNINMSRFEGPIYDTSEAWTNFFASRTDLSKTHPPLGTKQ